MTTWPTRRTSTGCTPITPPQGDVHIYQFSTSSAVAGFLAERTEPLIVDFHNFTGPEHFAGWEPHTEERAARAHDELVLLAPRAQLGLADSHFNERDLRQAGYRRTAVVPVLVDYRARGRRAAPTAGWRPSSPPSRPAAAPTSSSWGGSSPPRPSTNW